MALPDSQTETVELLTRLAGRAPIETHISAVFPGHDTVWKLKKAVSLSFLDFSTISARERFCRRELHLNQDAAPGLYRDVVAVTRGPQGALMLGGEGVPVDWVLRMAPVPEADFLDRIARDGRFDARLQDEVADAVADFHRALPPVDERHATARLRAVMEGNEVAAKLAGLDPSRVDGWGGAMGTRMSAIAEWLDARGRAGFVRRAHGDLHLGNLCLWHGRPVLFDALEFNEGLATIDLGYDLAFLLMDIERLAGRPTANRVLNRYLARTGDAAVLRGLPVFLSMRAMVRSHVAATRHATDEALPYLDAALAYLIPVPPLVVAVGGLPGTGKSTLARALAPELGLSPGALIVRSDEIRKRQHGGTPEQKLPPSAYDAASNQRVFEEILAETTAAAQCGHAVIADASFTDPAQQAAVAAVAAAAGVPFLGLWLEAPIAVLEARIEARRDDASDATVEVLRAFVRLGTPTAVAWLGIDALRADKALAAARQAVGRRAGASQLATDVLGSFGYSTSATGRSRNMAIRKILLPLTGTAAGESAMTVALMVARLWNAHVTALHVRVDSRDVAPLAGEGLSGAMIEEMMSATEKESGARASAVRSMFERFVVQHNVTVAEARAGADAATASFAAVTGREEDLVAQHARLADLTVVPHPDSGSDVSSSDALHAVLFDSGRPVLIAPPEAPATIGRRICLGWNGTAESTAAVLAALPWLQQAEAVRILSSDDYQRRGPGAHDLAEYLALHGVQTDSAVFKAENRDVGAGMLAATREFRADLLVMGAYSHSRLRQLILGGVTRHVLENATIPVLMCR